MANNASATPEEEETWRIVIEGLSIGAFRGMIRAHESLPGNIKVVLPGLSEDALVGAVAVLIALFLETRPECSDAEIFPSASQEIERLVLSHLEAFRAQREETGEGAFDKIARRAGVKRHDTD